ncbi:Sec63-domain-containing protein [Nadsonia fulvescens var. elongata DSM 6958]|uniref:Sec63-domain-containing protein n=1 Tax=Nadsonia fulvescens var. elongata DSM 6958 TaxID=857566 RepID=A0A1E3PM47_9ASCO|nr:Sec63-domain-containing protein [Nadsonia fulvescens var. elongata DSM 6958]
MPPKPDLSGYKYEEMSNQVLWADRQRGSEDTSAVPESLRGKIRVHDMGSKVVREKLADSDMVDATQSLQRRSKSGTPNSDVRNGTSLLADSTDSMEGLLYIPRLPETREIFGMIMAWTQEFLEDVPHEIIRSAADAILATLKDENLKDLDRKQVIEEIVGSFSNDAFHDLIGLGKQITDYDNSDDENAENEAELDEEVGVAVVFDDSENERDDRMSESDDDEDEGDSANIMNDDDESLIDDVRDRDGEMEIDDTIVNPSVKSIPALSDSIPAQDIDAFWLQRNISGLYADPHIVHEKTSAIFDILTSNSSINQMENDLMELFDFEYMDFIAKLCKNREKIVWLTRYNRAETELEKNSIQSDMENNGLGWILQEASGIVPVNGDIHMKDSKNIPVSEFKSTGPRLPKEVDLDSLVFDKGGHTMTVTKVKLPKGSVKYTKKQYEEYVVPPPTPNQDKSTPLVTLASLPPWTQSVFGDTKSLNKVQSKVFPKVFQSDNNILLCAPTGAGKTNVAMLAILRTIEQFRNPDNGNIRLNAFKIVYIAPLKALVQEQVREFGKSLGSLGLKVAELTGDSNLTKQQIAETQMIVTTPEKWDVITRKSSDTSYTNLVRLIIVDEIHLLHDVRGPVIESIVSRTVRRVEAFGEPVRLIGLSATLPNYVDVAAFLRVDVDEGLFYFDSSYRPCPLAQKFIGITEKKAIKRYQAMNDACYDKVLEAAGKHQVIIFVHSRKETAKTAKFLRDKALEEGTLNNFLKSDTASREILRTESETVENTDLQDLLPTGFAIHHAGLSKADRSSAEDLFAQGYVQVLVSTATLAWGVNLPAHTVIIKGTQVYSPELGKWDELSPQDVLQMLGRAGRPRYDVSGEGVIITTHSELNYYMSLINQQLPIESQLMSKLADSMNAEIVLGTIRSREEAIKWLSYSYLYIRMLRAPLLYHVGAEYEGDKDLYYRRMDLAHSALLQLEKSKLLKYDRKSGKIVSNELGKIASHYYISHTSMAVYNNQLKPHMTPIELFRIFAMSEEFKYIPVRQEEKLELLKLLEKAPIPVKEGVDEPSAKVNILLQAFISRLKLKGFALMSDMIYVTQSAGRLFRAIYEICLRKNWAMTTKAALDLCKCVEKQIWLSSSPFRQYPGCPPEVIRKTETSHMPWSMYFDLQDPAEVGQAIRVEKAGKLVYNMLQEFPRVSINALVQPMTSTLLRVELEITPKFTWNYRLHGTSEPFIILVEDCDGEKILYRDSLVIRGEYINDEHIIDFTVPIPEILPPNYFVSVISERWLHSEARVALSFLDLKIPAKFPAHTPVYELQPLKVSSLERQSYIDLYPSWDTFNKIQTQAFHTLYTTNLNTFIGASIGSGKTVCAELAILNYWEEGEGRVVYIAPFQEQVDELYPNWNKRLSSLQGGKSINKLTGDLTSDLKILDKSHLVLATPNQWDVISRRWQKRRTVQSVGLFIADDMHMIGGFNGAVYEVTIARMRLMSHQLESPLRIIGLSVPLADGKITGEWIGANKKSIFNFAPQERQTPLEIRLQALGINHHPSLMIAMARPTFNALKTVDSEPAIVFVDSRKQCVETSLDLIKLAYAEGNEDIFRHAELDVLEPYLSKIKDTVLKESLSHGIGYYYSYMNPSDKKLVKKLYESGAVQVLIATRDSCWVCPKAHLVVVMGTQFYEGKEHRYVDYPISEILQMLGQATLTGEIKSGKSVILTNNSKKAYYHTFLDEALPIESHLNMYLPDVLCTEISERVISSMQDSIDWLTFSFFYRRIITNPSFYGLADTSPNSLSEYLSELVESTLTSLSEANLIDMEGDQDDEITPLNGGIIASYYNISFFTIQTFYMSLTSKTKLKALLQIITSATDFDFIPIRQHEDQILGRIYDKVPVKHSEPSYISPHFKAFVLLQAHLSRLSLPPDLEHDQRMVLEKILPLVAACVDVMSGDGYLNAMVGMDLSQMVVQAVWDGESPLRQVPYFTPDRIKRLQDANVESVYDILSLEEEQLTDILQMPPKQLDEAVDFINKYPSIEVSHDLGDESIVANEPFSLVVTLERDVDEDDPVGNVHASFYPIPKAEYWWVVVGDLDTKQLYAIKRTTITKALQQVKLEVTVPQAGEHSLSIWCVCDSYIDADKEIPVNVLVEEAKDEAEDDEDVDEHMEE